MKPKITVKGGEPAKVSEQTMKRIRNGLEQLERPYPQIGDEWEFKLPHMKAKRKKIVGNIGTKEFIIERGTYPKWENKTERLPYVHWERQNKGRYTGVTVRRLMEFGQRLSTKAEREARYAAIAEQRKREREARRKI